MHIDKLFLDKRFTIKAEHYSYMYLCPYKRQISMLRMIALQGVRAHKNVAYSSTGKTFYITIEVV